MTQLSAAQIAGVASAAGFTGEALTTAVAVALAESNGDTAAQNSVPCVGLWQINMLVWTQYTVQQMQQPAQNAAAAFAISSGGTNWKPWDTFNSGAYLTFIDQAAAAAHTPSVYTPVHVDPAVRQQTSFSDDWPTNLTALRLNGSVLRADLLQSTTNATLEQRIDGASTVELDIADPAAVLVNEKIWTTKATLTLDGLRFRYTRLDRDSTGMVLTATFEDDQVAKLRDSKGHIVAPAGTTTRTEFCARLCKMVKVPFYGCTVELTGSGTKRGLVVAKDELERQAVGSDGVTPEDSWDCIGRIATDLNWRRFSTGRAIWFGPDAWIRAHIASTHRLVEGRDGVGRVAFGWDPRVPDGNEANFTLDGGSKWRPVIGQGVTLVGLGPASVGAPWLVTDVSRPRFSARATVTLGRAQRDTPAAASTSALTDDGSITSAGQFGTTPKAVVQVAYNQLGKPYLRVPFPADGSPPASFDCSSLTMWCWLKGAGKTIPPISQLQWSQLTHVTDAQRQPGDIACFGTTDNCSHVGLYVGGDSMIAADDTGIPIGIDTDISTWTNPPYLGCVRP